MKPARLLLTLLLLTGCGYSPYRITGDDPAWLEAEVVTLTAPDGFTVLAPAMLHLGEESYYDAVARVLSSCDIIIIEGIRGVPDRPPIQLDEAGQPAASQPAGSAPREGPDPRAFDLLELISRQLALVTQQGMIAGLPKDKLINVDMSWEELVRDLEETGEPALRLTPPGLEDVEGDIIKIHLMTYTRERVAETATTPNQGKEVVIRRRNERVVEAVLRLREDERLRKVGICYGGGHLEGLVEALLEHGFTRQPSQWLRVFHYRPGHRVVIGHPGRRPPTDDK